MKGADLAQEALAFAQAWPQHRGTVQRLVDLGISLQALGTVGEWHFPPGLARANWMPNSFWQPQVEGQLSLTVPVCRTSWFRRWGEDIDTLEVIDIMALRTDQPQRWAWRSGYAWALGEELLEHPTGDPVDLVATPIGWLAKGGAAVCILNWNHDSPAWMKLRGGPPLIPETPYLAKRLERAVRDSIRLHFVGGGDAA